MDKSVKHEPCTLCGGEIGPDITDRPMCYGCGPADMRPSPAEAAIYGPPPSDGEREAFRAATVARIERMQAFGAKWSGVIREAAREAAASTIAGTPATMLGEAEAMARRISDLCQRVVELEAMAGRAMSDVYGYAAQTSGRASLIARDLRAAKRDAEALGGAPLTACYAYEEQSKLGHPMAKREVEKPDECGHVAARVPPCAVCEIEARAPTHQHLWKERNPGVLACTGCNATQVKVMT